MTIPVRASFHRSTTGKPVQQPARRPVITANGKLAGRPVATAGQQLRINVAKQIPANQQTASKLPTAQTIKPPAPNTPAVADIAPAIKKEQANTTMHRALMAAAGGACLGAAYLALRLTAGSNNSSHSSDDPAPSNTALPYPCTKVVKFLAPYNLIHTSDAEFQGTCLNGELTSLTGSLFCTDETNGNQTPCTANGTFTSMSAEEVLSRSFWDYIKYLTTSERTLKLQEGNFEKQSFFLTFRGTINGTEWINTTISDLFSLEKLIGNFSNRELTSGEVYDSQGHLYTDGNYVYDSKGKRNLHGIGTSCSRSSDWINATDCWTGEHVYGVKTGTGEAFSLYRDGQTQSLGQQTY